MLVNKKIVVLVDPHSVPERELRALGTLNLSYTYVSSRNCQAQRESWDPLP
jgi:hypothetical protein